MNHAQFLAYTKLAEAGSLTQRVIVHAKASLQALELPDEIVAKVIEAQQALYTAQRMMEKLK